MGGDIVGFEKVGGTVQEIRSSGLSAADWATVSGTYALAGIGGPVLGTALTPAPTSTSLTVGVVTPWGITAAGSAYYDPAGAAAGEEAYPEIDTTGRLILVQLSSITQTSVTRFTKPVVIGIATDSVLHAGYNLPAGHDSTLSVVGALSVLSSADDEDSRIWSNRDHTNVLSICNRATYGDSAIKFLASDALGNREQCAIGFNTDRSDDSYVFQGVAFWESSNFVNGDYTTDTTRPWIPMHVVQTGTFGTQTTAAGTVITGGFSSYLRLQFGADGCINMYGVAPNVVRWSLDGDGVVYMHSAATTPSVNPNSGGFLFVDTDGTLKYRGLSGTVTTLAAP